MQDISDTVIPLVSLVGSAAVLSIPLIGIVNDVADGIQVYLKAKCALERIAAGERITSEHHYALNDAKIDPIASYLMQKSGSMSQLYQAVRVGRQAQNNYTAN